MERFCIGQGLFILREGRTLQFSHRSDTAIYFREASTGEVETLEENRFWHEVEQCQISVLARAILKPVCAPSAQENKMDRTACRLPHNMGKTLPTLNSLAQFSHDAPPRVDHAHVTLIANIIDRYLTGPVHMPVAAMYVTRYPPALMQFNAERARTGVAELLRRSPSGHFAGVLQHLSTPNRTHCIDRGTPNTECVVEPCLLTESTTFRSAVTRHQTHA